MHVACRMSLSHNMAQQAATDSDISSLVHAVPNALAGKLETMEGVQKLQPGGMGWGMPK